jgi:hypothetical protein
MGSIRIKRKKTPKNLRSGRNKLSGKYERQRRRTEKNKLKRRVEHFWKHPNDSQIRELMSDYRQ